MEKVTFKTIEVDRCTSCKGIWFDAHEKEKLRKMEGAEQIDIGSTVVGDDHNEIHQIRCPICNKLMASKVDPSQNHIRFEQCIKCKGAFFDAGEFRDYKDESFFDLFKGFWPKKKTK
jgi:Zn-finger nucleic acid-binding protein